MKSSWLIPFASLALLSSAFPDDFLHHMKVYYGPNEIAKKYLEGDQVNVPIDISIDLDTASSEIRYLTFKTFWCGISPTDSWLKLRSTNGAKRLSLRAHMPRDNSTERFDLCLDSPLLSDEDSTFDSNQFEITFYFINETKGELNTTVDSIRVGMLRIL